MHIVYVTREYPPSLRGGGIASYVKEMAHGLHELGYQVTVVAASDDTRLSSEYDDNGVRVIRLKGGDFIIPQVEGNSYLKKFRMFYRFYSYRKRVLNTVKRLKDIDVIEVPEYGAEGYFLNKLDVPVITRLHTPAMFDRNSLSITQYHGANKIFEWTGRKELGLIKKSKYLSSCSAALAKWTADNLGVGYDRIKVIYNPVSLPEKVFGQPMNNNKISIVYVGTISDVKGCGDLLETGKNLAGKNISFDMYLYGKMGEYAKSLKEEDFPWFHVMGKVNREEVFDIYRKATIVCIPSWWDNMPMVCLEAMGVGAVVLGSVSGGMSEIIEDEKSGFLIEPHHPLALAEKIMNIVNLSDEQRALISGNARKRIHDNFGKDVIMREMVEYYQDVIDDNKNANR
mgnify:CR=1 FL=1